MDNIHVQCPECSHEFNAAEQLKLHFKQIVMKDKLLDEQNTKITQLQNDKSFNREEIDKLKAELVDSKKIARKEIEEEYKDFVKNAYQKGLNAAKLNVKSLRKEAREAAKDELQDEIKKASESAFQNGILAAEQKLQEQQGGADGASFQDSMQAQQAQQSQQVNQVQEIQPSKTVEGTTQASNVLLQAQQGGPVASTTVGQAAKVLRSQMSEVVEQLVNGQDKMAGIMKMALSGKKFNS